MTKESERTVGGEKTLLPNADPGEVNQWLNLSELSSSAVSETNSLAKENERSNRPSDPQQSDSPDEFENHSSVASLRPNSFEDYIGQATLKRNVLIALRACLERGEPLDHLLLHGPPGLGKTSLAKLVARELGVGFRATSGPVIERPGDLAAVLSSLEENEVLFIDEIHRLSRVVEEVLYPAMEDFQIDILIGQGPAARSVKIKLKPFTLIGATTRSGALTSPLRDRFGMVFRLEFYAAHELQQIIVRSAHLLRIEIAPEAAAEIGLRARGTPRIANRLLKRVRDFAQSKSSKIVTLELARQALALLEIDQRGLDRMDRYILETIIDKFSGGPVGIDTISAAVGEDKGTIEDMYEPFLVQEGLLARTRRGREVTELAFSHLGRKYLGPSQLELVGN